MDQLMRDKVVIITGGASGIGLSAAKRFAHEGASVAVVDINQAQGEQVATDINAKGGTAVFIRADLSNINDIKAMVDTTVKTFGRLDAAFNNAGTSGSFTNIVDCTEQEWDFVSNLNLKSVWACMKYQIPYMLKTGGGAIVNTASEAANTPPPHMATYIATKAGVVGLTRSAAIDYADQNIRVNALLPGPTVTPMMQLGASDKGLDRKFSDFLPMKRLGQPHEQSDVALWLCSEQSSFVTGMAISVDGGLNLT